MSHNRILVTGGSGFIGSALVRHIISNTNDEVLNIDKLTYASNALALEGVSNSPRYSFEKLDICNFDAFSRSLELFEPNIVIHLAAESHVDRSISSSAEFLQTNIIGTYTILEALRGWLEKGAIQDGKRFVFHHVSTDEVFGDLPHPDFQADADLSLFTEQSPYLPSSPYSATKASSDHLVRAWARTYSIPSIVSNCSNNYGPFQHSEKLMPKIILNAAQGIQIPIYGNGLQIRDWLFVGDHAEALYLMATQATVGESYNIGGNNEIRNLDLVALVVEQVNRFLGTEKHYLDLVTFVSDRAGHDLRYAIRADKIKRDLGWSPNETISSGIAKTVEWYLKDTRW